MDFVEIDKKKCQTSLGEYGWLVKYSAAIRFLLTGNSEINQLL